MTATSTGIFIAQKTLETFAPELKADLLKALFYPTALSTTEANDLLSKSNAEPPLTNSSSKEDEDIADLTPALARRFVRGCNKKTTAALTAMVAGPTPEFRLSVVAKALPEPVAANKLGGVWAGLTRRTRTVTGEEDVYLIRWLPDEIFGTDGEYLDQTGALSDLTYRSLRRVLLDA